MSAKCPKCQGPLNRWKVCRACGAHCRLDVRTRLKLLTTELIELNPRLKSNNPLGFPGYESPEPESVVTAEATIDATPCVIIASDFDVHGGSMGVTSGEKIARAYERAVRLKVGVVAITASGGARMQEGMLSLVQLAKTAEARRVHASQGFGQVTLLTSPTTGGVYASYGSLADVVFAEPAAMVGFAGPRVIADTTGVRPDPRVHTAEFAQEHGMVDEIVSRNEQVRTIGSALRNLSGLPSQAKKLPSAKPFKVDDDLDAWQRLQLCRAPDRPTGADVAFAMLSDVTEVLGGRPGAPDPAVRVRLGVFSATGQRVLAIGQDASTPRGMRPSGYRTVARGLEIAARLKLPVITFIGTRGADPLPDSEAEGIAAHIARTIPMLLQHPAPTIAVVTGEGGSGGALSLAACDRVLMWSNAVFSVIGPEGAASILFRNPDRAPELAAILKITAADMLNFGIADRVVPEPVGGVQRRPAAAVRNLQAVIADELKVADDETPAGRMRSRHARWREAGRFKQD